MSDDQTLRQRVVDELDFDPRVNTAHIGVTARDGVVTLSGHVGGLAEKDAAERIVQRVRGVAAVAQELEVHLPSSKKVSDDEIAARAVLMLNWDVLIPHGRVTVKVERGYVTLGGNVEWHYQRVEAEKDVGKLSGIKAVINDIRVHQPVGAGDVEAKIHAALERNVGTEAHRVAVGVADGKVTLKGNVKAWAEREIIERAAWSVPGVTEIDDQIGLARP